MSSVLRVLALAGAAAAHGTVTGFTADGTYYGGFKLDYYYAEQNGGEIPEHYGWYAKNLDNGFIEPNSFGTADIICHKEAKPDGAATAKVAAGGTVDMHWSAWPESHVGPMITYVAKCAADCADADKESLKFVKIDEAGYDGGWASDKMIANNNTWSLTVPSTLAPGNYVFRHETIALHGASSENGAQAYPQCVNIEITGSGTDEPEGTLGTALYTADEDGIIFNPYASEIVYNIPGPALYGSGSDSGSGTTPTTPEPSASAPAVSAPAGGNGTTPTTPTATATPTVADVVPSASATAAPETGNGSAKTYTVESFIAWLEEQSASAAKAKARRHARAFF